MVSVDLVVIVVGVVVVVAVFSLLVWGIRHQDRMFPKGFDRTGWNPDGERAGWFRTTFTWLSGGRG